MDYDLTQETLPSGVQANGGNSFARASGDILVATNTLGAPTGETSKAGSPYVCTYPGNLGAVSFTIPRNGHTGVDVYYSNGNVVRDVFSGTASTWTIDYSSLYDWGSVFITGLKYYD